MYTERERIPYYLLRNAVGSTQFNHYSGPYKPNQPNPEATEQQDNTTQDESSNNDPPLLFSSPGEKQKLEDRSDTAACANPTNPTQKPLSNNTTQDKTRRE